MGFVKRSLFYSWLFRHPILAYMLSILSSSPPLSPETLRSSWSLPESHLMWNSQNCNKDLMSPLIRTISESPLLCQGSEPKIGHRLRPILLPLAGRVCSTENHLSSIHQRVQRSERVRKKATQGMVSADRLIRNIYSQQASPGAPVYKSGSW